MPMPKPRAGESRDDFLNRCMADSTMVADFDDSDQRFAVCNTQWRDRNKMERLFKAMGHVVHVKQEERNGQPIGIIEGYLATFDVDRGKDQFLKGCFDEAIRKLKERNRPLRMKYNHADLIGGFPSDELREDENGLFGVGEVNLNTQLGKEVFGLAKQGVLSDFSVGWSLGSEDFRIEDGVRKITKSGLWEASIVDEPMNPKAVVTSVKRLASIEALPELIADVNLKWDQGAAEKRWGMYHALSFGDAFLWHDEKQQAYKLQVVDMVDGKEMIVPRAVFVARAELSGARGGVEIPEADIAGVKRIINELYERLGLDAPYDGDEEKKLTTTEVRSLPDSHLCDMIKAGRLSGNAADWLALQRPPVKVGNGGNEEKAIAEQLDSLKEFIQEINQ